ncbi:MAG: DUF2520 domain-containing protein [Candidatus Schekmanbacteria bacterium]|nr:DUF2520 domain-containing protein [Candidatus Schekmanbacteria bacterium]
MSNPIISIIGAGKVGTSIGYLVYRQGYPLAVIASRTIESAQRAVKFIGAGRAITDPLEAAKSSQILFITTPDRTIEAVCNDIAGNNGFCAGQIVVHCSGALSSDILEPARRYGALIASLHPLQTFANPQEAVKLFAGSYCTFEGDSGAREILKKLVTDLSGHFLEINSKDKILYHAAAVIACNYLVTLISGSLQVYEAIGIAFAEAYRALKPLIAGTLHNIEQVGIPQALTGPIARGDWEIIQNHLQALTQDIPQLVDLYKILAEHTIPLAEAKGGIDSQAAEKLRKFLGEKVGR